MGIGNRIVCCDCVEDIRLGRLVFDEKGGRESLVFGGRNKIRSSEVLSREDVQDLIEFFLIAHLGHEIRVINDVIDDFYDLEPNDYQKDWDISDVGTVEIDDELFDRSRLSNEEAERVRNKLKRFETEPR